MNAPGERGDAIRVAVVGAGEFGRNHARVYRELPGAMLAGIYDLDPQKAAALAQAIDSRGTQEHRIEVPGALVESVTIVPGR